MKVVRISNYKDNYKEPKLIDSNLSKKEDKR